MMTLLKNIRAGLVLVLWLLWALAQFPFLLLIASWCRRFGVWQMRIFMYVSAKLFGVRFKRHGRLDKTRPLLLIGNHISIFEIIALPSLFGNGFFTKADVGKWPVLGWYIKWFGNILVDRRPSKALEVAAKVQKQMASASQPFAIFPEGTTNNGDYVLPFKSAAFDFLKNNPGARVQPMVIFYRDKHGKKIPPQVLANEYAYISNAKQTQPPYAEKELSIMQLLWNTLVRGGFTFEIYALPVFNPNGLDRKEIAAALYKIVSEKFMEFK